jgi:inhibitor of KinA sporulation pathway (predicted exonuclease)
MFDACFVSPKLWYFAKQLDHLAWCQVDPGAEFSTQVT